jgi:hypothetical protein
MPQDITDLIDGLSDAGRAEDAAIARRLALIGELDALAATVCANDRRTHQQRRTGAITTATPPNPTPTGH